MADFCRDCTIRLVGEDLADKNDMIDPNLGDDFMQIGLCEGCGPGYFDNLGRRLEYNEDIKAYEYKPVDLTESV